MMEENKISPIGFLFKNFMVSSLYDLIFLTPILLCLQP